MAEAATDAEGQQHPIKLYLVVWGWLFVLSTCSYLVDYFGLQGDLRWGLILLFMILKAGLIVAVFMHMAWERLALAYAILLPPVLVLVFVAIMVFESDYTLLTREFFRCGSLSFGRGRCPRGEGFVMPAVAQETDGSACRYKAREAVALFDDYDDLVAAIEELELAGFDRSQINLMRSCRSAERMLRRPIEDIRELETSQRSHWVGGSIGTS